VFSSEIKSILHYEQKKPSFNVRELKDKLYYQPWDQDETIFENIYNVKPGHYLTYDIQTGHCTQNHYWQINYEQENYTQEPLEAILHTYKEKIVKGVERRLVADVPVASYLSGGIDSSVCYGISSTLKGKGIDAFTISFDDKDYDESIQAEKLVKKYSGTQYVLNVTEQQLADNLESHIWCLENLTFNPHGVAKHLLSQLVREKGYKVVITGEGSDEYNCGYITNVLDAMQVNPSHFDRAAIQEKIEVNKGAFLSDNPEEIPFIQTLLKGSLSYCSNAVSQMKLINNLFSEDYREINPEQKFERYFKKHFRETKNWDFLNISLYYQSITTFSYVLTALGDRTEMAHSVEARLPFLDNDVIDYITKVPPKFKYYNNIDKFLLRESCKEYVTAEHYQTKKHPYLAPPTKKNSPFNTLMKDMFHSQKFLNLGLFDKNKLNLLLESYTQSNTNDPFTSRILFCILSVAMVQSVFDVV
jgi:asparagine synthase (glutamine-hydrolysing)